LVGTDPTKAMNPVKRDGDVNTSRNKEEKKDYHIICFFIYYCHPISEGELSFVYLY
jgi:hypothetical protein